MNKTSTMDSNEKITVDIKGLMGMCSVGRATAEKIGKEAGAVTKVGGRKLYNVRLVQQYMDSLSENFREGKESD